MYDSLPREDYMGLMSIADAMIGNSSSGIIEAPSFKLPFINIGTRQKGRETSGNVIEVDYDKKEITAAIRKALYNKNFKEKMKKCRNIYGEGNSGKKIAHILSKLKIDKELLQKNMV